MKVNLNEYYYAGTLISLLDNLDLSNNPKEEYYILAQVFDKDFFFQIIRISGYNSGLICGFIKEDPIAKENNTIGVTKPHLINELQRNLDFNIKTLRIFDTQEINISPTL